jgi:hypothetical protein
LISEILQRTAEVDVAALAVEMDITPCALRWIRGARHGQGCERAGESDGIFHRGFTSELTMQCPPVIAEIVCEILRIGLLRMRAFGWKRNPERCAVEADHLHNLPGLLVDYKAELLDYYWRAERVGFIECSTVEDANDFEPLWKSLAEFIETGENVADATR